MLDCRQVLEFVGCIKQSGAKSNKKDVLDINVNCIVTWNYIIVYKISVSRGDVLVV